MMTIYNIMPQPVWSFVDEDGNPLSFGTVTSFKAEDQSTLKALYRDREATVAFTNPYTLSKAGTMPLPYGADDENYYLEVKDSGGAIILTIDDFNANAAIEEEIIEEEGAFTKNYILNSQFRFFEQASFTTDDFPAGDEIVIANEGWSFQRTGTTTTLDIGFSTFPAGQDDVGNTPTFYLYFNKLTAAGEAKSDFIYRLGRVQDFANREVTLSVRGKSPTSSNLAIGIELNYGEGGSASHTDFQAAFLSFTDTWDTATATFTMPDIAGKTLGTPGTDFVNLRLRTPLDENAEFNFTNIQYNLGAELAPFEFKSYYEDLSERNAYLLPPSIMAENQYSFLISDGEKYIFENFTGSIIYSSKGEPYPGYINADGSTVVRTAKVGSSKVTYDRLYQAWENDSSLGNGNAYGYGEDGFFPMRYTKNIVMVNEKEEKAITPWSAGDTGFSVLPIRPGANYQFNTEFFSETAIDARYTANSAFSDEIAQSLTVINKVLGIATDAALGTINTFAAVLDISVVQDGAIDKNEITTLQWKQTAALSSPSAASIRWFTISSPTTTYKIYFVVDGVGSVPTGTETKVPVYINTGDSRTAIVLKIKTALEGTDAFDVIHQIGLQVSNKQLGLYNASPNRQNCNLDLVATFNPGAFANAHTNILGIPAGYIPLGSYFDLSNTTTDFRIWFTTSGNGSAPPSGGKTLIQVELKASDTSVEVLWRIAQALKGKTCHKIICKAASTLSGGEALLFENDGGSFYTYYTIDGVGDDPELPSKTSIKTELKAGYTDEQVAEATAKSISSYYFKIPNYNGYFLRPLDETGEVDTGLTLRLPRDDGNARALLGTLQSDSNRSHAPGLIGKSWSAAPSDGLPESDTIAGGAIASDNYYRLTYRGIPSAHHIPFIETTGFEGRPKNIAVKTFIKF